MFCHDCKKEIKVDEKEELIDAVQLKFKDGDKDIFVFKCNDCYAKSPALTNFRACEVFTRTVGYYRPVQNFHKGKLQEYSERKVFKEPELST